MNIFVTGGDGFIGKSLIEYLRNNKSYKIFAPSINELDLSNENDLDTYLYGKDVDLIVHCANKGGGRDVADMKNITEYNLRMFFNVARHESKVKRIITFGSGAEYCKHKPIVDAKEDDDVDYPIDEYGFYKLITSKFAEKSKNILSLRIFGVYGEYENFYLKFISNAIVKNLLHFPIVINKNVYFDYIYINDLLRMVVFFIENDPKYHVYNITRGEKVDLITLANFVNENSDFQSDIIVLNEGLNDEYTSSNTRLMSELEVFEFTSHEKAISNMRDYYKTIFDSIDKKKIENDPYLKECNNFWRNNKK